MGQRDFDEAMRTRSLRKAARCFSESAGASPRSALYIEQVFIAGAAWALAQIEKDARSHLESAGKIFALSCNETDKLKKSKPE